jgi:hypothetical protein
MNFLNKETLIDGAALGAGVVAGRVVVNKLGSKLEPMLVKAGVPADKVNLVTNALPIVGGIATLYFGKGNRIATGVANGMFAASFGFYVDTLLETAGVNTGKSGVGSVLMQGAFMGEAPAGNVMMGAAEDMPNYSSGSFDFTGADSGELDY